MKLWYLEVHIEGEKGDGWFYPAGTANVAISRILRHHYLNKKSGRIFFREATREETQEYLKDHPNSRLAKRRRN